MIEKKIKQSVRTTVSKCFEYSGSRFRTAYRILVVTKAGLGVLDVVALGILASLGQVVFQERSSLSQQQSTFPIGWLRGLAGDDNSRARETLIVVSGALVLFTVKSIASILVNFRLNLLLAKVETDMGTQIFRKLITRQLDSLKLLESQQIAQALSTGVSAASIRSLSFFATVVGELFLLVAIGGVLFVVEPVLTLGLGLYIAVLGVVLHRLVARPSEEFGLVLGDSTIDSMRTVQDSLRTVRETRTLGKSEFIVHRYQTVKSRASYFHARLLTLVGVPRQVVDTALILGVSISAAILFSQHETEQAIESIMFLMIAGARLAPSLLAMQGAHSALRVAQGEASHLYQLMEVVGLDQVGFKETKSDSCMTELNSECLIVVSELSFTYPETGGKALADISFSVNRGTFTAVIGPSGSGKTTLIDVLLGVLEPQGQIQIEGWSPRDFVKRFPGRVGYVPQDPALVAGNLAENVAFGCDPFQINHSRVVEALEAVGLGGFIESLPRGIFTSTGEYGNLMSGGQKQRVGLARALYMKPDILLLDEPTSALDIESEQVILALVEQLKGKVTIVMIAHKLSSVVNADQILVLEHGCLVGTGSLSDLVGRVRFLAGDIKGS